MIKKPSTLDCAIMCSLNTTIACRGLDKAKEVYLDSCHRAQVPVNLWVINYYRLYAKYRAKPKPGDNYIDVKAAQRALDES